MSNNNDKFISDIINIEDLKKDQFNLIASGCGTGKSYFIANELLDKLNNVEPQEIMFITSRTITVEQQSNIQEDLVEKFNSKDIDMIKDWNGEINLDDLLSNDKIQLMTYDKLVYILTWCNCIGKETLSKIKVIVFDECHTLFSDKFINDIEVIKVWIREHIYRSDKIFIGLTATPNILHFYSKGWGVAINQLNEEIYIKYHAKNLYYTEFENIPHLLSDCSQFKSGKTIILCYSISDCNKLKEDIKNSAVLISKSNKKYSDQYNDENMDELRSYIIENENLPEMITINNESESLNVLITTSTLREGINLNINSNIKNVICCIPDELHISQFIGRCRFDIENLIIAYEYFPNSIRTNKYLQQERDKFKSFYNNSTDEEWFNSIKHLLEEGVNPIKINSLRDKDYFNKYINDNWTNKKIHLDEDKQEILDIAISCKIINDVQQSKITFNKVMNYIQNELGYEIETGRLMIDGTKYTYKLIIKQ